jgi:hypothetical protein
MGILDQWRDENEAECGFYSVYAGFEKAIRGHSDRLRAAWDDLDIHEQVALFAFVSGLLEVDHG